MKELQQRLGGVALQTRDAEGDFIGFTKIVEQLNAANVDGIESLRLFGLRAGPGMAALMNQGKLSTEDLAAEIRKMGGIADTIASSMEAGLGGEMRRTIAVMEGFQIALGEALGPQAIVFMKGFQDRLTSLINTIQELDENGAFQHWGQAALDIMDAITWTATKTYNSLSALTSVSIAMASAITGDFDTAKAAMEGWVNDVNKLFGSYEEAVNDNVDGVVTKAITDDMRKAADPSGPIGKGAKIVADNITNNIVPNKADLEARLKAALVIVGSELDKENAQLEADYAKRLISLDSYYNSKIEAAREFAQAERDVLQQEISTETDVNKREILNAKLIALENDLAAEVISINTERYTAQKSLDAKMLRETESLDAKRIKAERIVQDQKDRILEGGVTTLDTLFAKEIADLQTKHATETEVIQSYHDGVLEMLRERNASEMEINAAYEAQRLALADQTNLQIQEKEQQMADQSLRLSEYRLNNLANIAQGTAQMFEQLYQLTGEQNRELFYAAKGAALAEATINIATGVTKALAQGGVFGIATGALVAAAGAVEIGTILSQGLAAGGEVAGSSPHAKADNIPIRATAGEFMMPVSTVRQYGIGVMEALRTQSIPKAALTGYGLAYGGMVREHGWNARMAEGGSVGTEAPAGPQVNGGGEPVSIVNVIDPNLFEQYTASPAGQKTIMNVITENQFQVKQILSQ